jgi:NADH-quinone oxidoreductase subunit G
VALVGSGRSSVEEQFLTRKLADATGAPTWLVGRVWQGDGLLISADRNPNVRGALVTGLISALPSPELTELAAQIDAGKIKTVVSIGEDLIVAGLRKQQLDRISIVYLGPHANATSAAAKVVIPTLTVFEKSGTFVNQQFRIQKFTPAVPGPSGVADDLAALSKLVAAAGGPTLAGDIDDLWTTLAAEVKPLVAVTYRNLPASGLLLDATDFAGLRFPEGETLHFKPAQVAAVVP